MAAKKSGGSLGRRRAADQSRAKHMADDGVVRSSFRDPILNVMRPVGTYPGTIGGKIKG